MSSDSHETENLLWVPAYTPYLDQVEEAWHEDLTLAEPLSALEAREFCRHLECSYGDLPGGYINYQYLTESDIMRCQFDYCSPFRGQEMAVRFIVVFGVHSKDGMNGLRVICTNDWSRRERDLEELREEKARGELLDWIGGLIDQALHRTRTEYRQRITVVRRYLANPTDALATSIRLLPGLTVQPTVLLNNGQLAVGAITYTFLTVGEAVALEDAAEAMNKALDMITFSLGPQQRWRGNALGQDVPGMKDWDIFIGSVRSLRRIYSGCGDYVKYNPSPETDSNARRMRSLADILARIGQADERVWRCMAAFRDAEELRGRRASLATVAYSAALASLCTPQYCKGRVTCSECGAIERSHQLEGERAAVEKLILAAVPGVDSTVRARVRAIARDAYGEVRSGFVHDAHTPYETGRVSEVERMRLIRPSDKGPLLKELNRKGTVGSFPALTKRAIIVALANSAGYELIPADWGLDRRPVTQVLGGSAMRLARTARGVLQVQR